MAPTSRPLEASMIRARLRFNASTDLEVYNKTLTESVSGFGVSVAVTETDVDASNTVVVGDATIDAGISDVEIFTDHEALIVADTNLTMVSAVSGAANATTNARYTGNNTINFNDADVKGRNVEVYAGQAKNATGNDLYVNSAANIFAASMYPNISIPIALGDVDENNRINVTGDSRLRAVQDVALEALTGIAAGDRVLREGAVVSLSAIPYGFDAIQNGDDDTTNRVSIGSNTEVTGGAFNELSYKVFAINNPDNMGSGTNANIPLPAGVDLSSGPVTLTSQQKNHIRRRRA